MLTAETITDEEIRELRRTQSPVTGNCAWLCTIALGEDDESTAPERHEARTRCAEILNARAAANVIDDRAEKRCQCCGEMFREGPTSKDHERFARGVCGACDEDNARAKEAK